jgi:hypothetical protein
MKRHLLNFLTGLSLLLCAATAVLWVRSHRVGSVFGYYADLADDGWYRDVHACSHAGRLTLVTLHSKFDDQLRRGRFHAWDDPHPAQPRHELFGFGCFHVQGREMGWTEIRAPYWSIAILAGIAPLFTVVRSVRRKRGRPANLCPRCGYDLRATPDRCPECGRAAAGGVG